MIVVVVVHTSLYALIWSNPMVELWCPNIIRGTRLIDIELGFWVKRTNFWKSLPSLSEARAQTRDLRPLNRALCPSATTTRLLSKRILLLKFSFINLLKYTNVFPHSLMPYPVMPEAILNILVFEFTCESECYCKHQIINFKHFLNLKQIYFILMDSNIN